MTNPELEALIQEDAIGSTERMLIRVHGELERKYAPKLAKYEQIRVLDWGSNVALFTEILFKSDEERTEAIYA